MRFFIHFLLPLSLLSLSASAEGLPQVKGSNAKLIEDYLKVHKQFIQESCTPGTEEKFNTLTREFNGNGFYVPILSNGKMEREALKELLPEVEAKIKWLNEMLEKLEAIHSFKPYLDRVKSSRKELYGLLRKGGKAPTGDFNSFKAKMLVLIKDIPFLHSYGFPVNHFQMRWDYDRLKNSKKSGDENKAVKIYFQRKILEDGAQNPDFSKNDLYLRGNLDNVYTALYKSTKLTEKLRYDLSSVLKSLERLFSGDVKGQIDRMREWKQRTERAHAFYSGLIMPKNDKAAGDNQSMLESISKARFELKNFVMQKEALAYQFWSKERELYQALYSLETILFNEVGGMDGRDALERTDVAQVVINRIAYPRYSSLNENDGLYSYLPETLVKKVHEFPWLNILFKDGEFSFTFFYMSGSVRTFCPDMTRNGRFLLKENLRIALNLLRSPRKDFTGLRYFSRYSMLGRIDMARLWREYRPLPERPGKILKGSQRLRFHLKKGDYFIFYKFKDENNLKYQVIEVNENKYVVNEAGNRFYHYRDPNMFRFFTRAKPR